MRGGRREHDAVREARDALVILAAATPVTAAVAVLVGVAWGDVTGWAIWMIGSVVVAVLLLGTLGSALLLADRLGALVVVELLEAGPLRLGHLWRQRHLGERGAQVQAAAAAHDRRAATVDDGVDGRVGERCVLRDRARVVGPPHRHQVMRCAGQVA